MVEAILDGQDNNEINALLRLLEETVPVEQIWLDTAEQSNDRSKPYDGIDLSVLREDLRRVYQALKNSGISETNARQRLYSIEPFNRYRELIKEL
jgi:hypothetical protein